MKLQHFINGKLLESTSGREQDVFNPATGAVSGQVALASVEEVNLAVAAASAAAPAWAEMAPLKRARILFKFKELIEKNHVALASAITREHGKVLSDAMGEVTRGLEIVEFACGAPQLMKTQFSDNIGGGAPGDCTGLLRAFIRHGFTNTAVCICDPDSIGRLQGRSPGEQIELAIGGRGSRLDPGPVDLTVTFVRTCDGHFELRDRQSHLASMVGDRFNMGDCAIVEYRGITILLTSVKTPPMDLGQWLHVGLDPAQFSFVAVKAAVAHRRAWDPISKGNVWVSTPGPCSSDLSHLPYRKLRRPVFPLDAFDS